jgi:hypothetical protein
MRHTRRDRDEVVVGHGVCRNVDERLERILGGRVGSSNVLSLLSMIASIRVRERERQRERERDRETDRQTNRLARDNRQRHTDRERGKREINRDNRDNRQRQRKTETKTSGDV